MVKPVMFTVPPVILYNVKVVVPESYVPPVIAKFVPLYFTHLASFLDTPSTSSIVDPVHESIKFLPAILLDEIVVV